MRISFWNYYAERMFDKTLNMLEDLYYVLNAKSGVKIGPAKLEVSRGNQLFVKGKFSSSFE